MFSANTRLPRSYSAREKLARVNKVIDDLDLHSCIDTFIGTDFVRGVSGGERKRTSIGMELVLSPKVLFLDEPTTGKNNLFVFQLSLLNTNRTRCIDSTKCYRMFI
jgi:ATP-binding cassette subfamily G (WHITE) protein 2